MEGLELLAEGREAHVYLRPDGTVLKLMRHASDRPRAEREAAVCRILNQARAAVSHDGSRLAPLAPTVLELVTVDGRPGLVMERIDGHDLLALIQRQPLRLFTAARVLAEVHAGLHRDAAPEALPELKVELRARIIAAEPLPEDLKDVAIRVLERLPDGDRLCHGDFHLGNMLGSWDSPTVIDWGHATRGDPIADVARTDLLHRHGELPPGTPAFFRILTTAGRGILTDRYVRTYQRTGGRPLGDTFDRWMFVHMAARLNEPIPEEYPMMISRLRQTALAAAAG
ncbi:MAG: phosphotransferase family protein [Microthrixaceae bacterium]